MKRIIYLMGTTILVLALAIGCTTSKDNIDDKGDGVIIDKDEQVVDNQDDRTSEEIINEYEEKVKESLSNAGDFIDKEKDKLSETEVDKMVTRLIKYTEENVDKVEKKINKLDKDQEIMDLFGDDIYLTQEQIDNIDDKDLKEELNKLQTENYRLINLEGQYYVSVNYEEFKRYEGHVSDELRDYIDLKARDTNKPVALDGGLYASYEDLAERIIASENYIKKYGGNDRYEEVLDMYRNKLSMYLSGLPNTPITEEGSDKIKVDLMDSYKKTSLIKDSSTGFIVGKYVNIIEKNQGNINDDIRNQAELLLQEAIELIGKRK